MGQAMPETSTMMRAWRTDSQKGQAASPGARMRPDGDGRSTGSSGSPSQRAGMDGFRRLGAAVSQAGLAAWSRTFGRRAARFEEALHGFAADLAGSQGPRSVGG